MASVAGLSLSRARLSQCRFVLRSQLLRVALSVEARQLATLLLVELNAGASARPSRRKRSEEGRARAPANQRLRCGGGRLSMSRRALDDDLTRVGRRRKRACTCIWCCSVNCASLSRVSLQQREYSSATATRKRNQTAHLSVD